MVMRNLNFYLSLLIIGLLAFKASPLLAQKTGEEVFTNRCTACHKVSNNDLVGPGLAHVNKRRDQEWLVSFIRNSQKMIKGGDEVAKKLFNEYNQTIMPANKDLSDEEIVNVLNYIKKESKGVDEPTADAGSEKEEKQAEEEGENYPQFSHMPEEQQASKDYAYHPNSSDFLATFWMVAILTLMAVGMFTWMVVYYSR